MNLADLSVTQLLILNAVGLILLCWISRRDAKRGIYPWWMGKRKNDR